MSKDVKHYWTSFDRRDRASGAASGPEFEVPTAEDFRTSRRGFLAAAGFGLAGSALASCSRAPVEQALPFLIQPEAIVPGRATHYASTCGACTAGCGLLVKTRDGRPIKLEGNPDHPLSRGGLCAVGQASILPLYDSQRLTGPLQQGKGASWAQVDGAIAAALAAARDAGRPVRLLTSTITSPTTRAVIDRFLAGFPGSEHVVYDTLSASAVLDAHERTHGVRVLPRYRFDRADVILGIDADFLGTWIAPVEYTAGYRAGRAPGDQPPRMSFHAQVEARLSLTGAKADRRVVVAPGEHHLVLAHVANRVARRAGVAPLVEALAPAPIAEAVIEDLGDRLWQARGHALVVCGSQDVALQVLGNSLNHLLGAYGATVDIERPSFQRQGSDRALERLVAEVAGGSVGALIIAGVNPVYELPGGAAFAEQLGKVPLVVSLASHLDETASVAGFVCPDRHPLESWSDAESAAGVVSVSQPTVVALGDTRQMIESLATWSGASRPAYELLREHWQARIYPSRSTPDLGFEAFWEKAVHDGFIELAPSAPAARAFTAVTLTPPATVVPDAGALALVLYPKVGMLDGRGGLNPWLHELPDPITKVTWDNYACLSPTTAARLNLDEGDVVRVQAGEGVALELPVCRQPGQHDGIVAIALGYGRLGSERFAQVGPRWLDAQPTVGDNGRVGQNAAPLAALADGVWRYSGVAVRATATGRRRALAQTQSHHEIAVPAHLAPPGGARRPIVQETTLAAYVKDPSAGSHGHGEAAEDLWPPDHQYTGHRWRMVIDLTKCTGCSACVVACQAENNVPVVGRDEVMRKREMHWMRIDRYYADGPDGAVDVIQQPMLCQHCENASCETVCPVLATVHSEEGLNQQVYNRCVGTRYCANNCAYKVRRFNWFEYPREDRLQNLVLNPDVVVRSRGVMEKCSLCVQRLQDAKVEARRQGRPLADGEARTACQQSCPAQAITFGDAHDPDSRVAHLLHDPRHFRVLEELNVKPSVGYLTLVRNRPGDGGEGGGNASHE